MSGRSRRATKKITRLTRYPTIRANDQKGGQFLPLGNTCWWRPWCTLLLIFSSKYLFNSRRNPITLRGFKVKSVHVTRTDKYKTGTELSFSRRCLYVSPVRTHFETTVNGWWRTLLGWNWLGLSIELCVPQRPIAKRQLTVSDQVSVELEAKTERALSLLTCTTNTAAGLFFRAVHDIAAAKKKIRLIWLLYFRRAQPRCCSTRSSLSLYLAHGENSSYFILALPPTTIGARAASPASNDMTFPRGWSTGWIVVNLQLHWVLG